MPELIVSNATGRNRVCAYRMPGEKERILKVAIIPFEINKVIDFPTEAHLREFKNQNGYLFAGSHPALIEGRQLGKRKLEKVNEAITKEESKKIDSEVKAAEEGIVNVAEERTGHKIKIEVEKVDKNAKKKK